jgi:outer membrane receptor protein involved in Fe transport
MMRSLLILVLILATILPLVSVNAGTTGKIVGTVLDADNGEPIIGGNVLVVDTYRGATTNLDGEYFILNVPPGSYTVRVSYLGYQTLEMEGVVVSIDRTVTINAELQSEAIRAETVTMVAQRPVIRMDVTSTEVSVGSEEIEAIPAENFGDVVSLQAGVVDGHFRGGRSSEVSYMVDGVVISDPYNDTDPFDRTTSNQVENAAIQEIQVIAGTFNSEYGQAMSGVVNVVTKDGRRNNYGGSVQASMGDYVSGRSLGLGPYKDGDQTYLDEFDVSHLMDYKVSFDGPVPFSNEKVTFFATGRFLQDNGNLYGQRFFNPSDSSDFSSTNPDYWYVENSGDAKIVTLNPFEKLSGQLKLSWFAIPELKLSYSLMRDHMEYQNLDNRKDDTIEDLRRFKYNPDGLYDRFSDGWSNVLGVNHVLGSRTFYNLNLSYTENEHEYYVHEDPLDPAYVNPDRLEDAQNYAYYTGGQGMWNHWRKTRKAGLKLDLNHQFDNLNQFKFGIDLAQYQLELREFRLIWDNELDRQVIDRQSIYFNAYPKSGASSPLGGFPFGEGGHRPTSFAAYAQDKLEYKSMVVNVGLRMDYFHPDAAVPNDLRDPGNDPLSLYNFETGETIDGLDPVNPTNPDGTFNEWRYKYRDAEAHVQVSPRIGVAFPLTEAGVIHFSYGHFFQVPPFQFLYYNPDFEVVPGGLESIIGNAELKPQKTVMYEIGFRQAITYDVGFEVTAFYKDVRNLLGTEILTQYDQTLFARYINRDYGNVRGLTLSFDRRMIDGFSFGVDYTYQIAEGNSSDPRDVFNDNQTDPPREPEKTVRPLDWDQTHTLNGTLTFGSPGDWQLGLVGSLGSGLPYTSNPFLAPEGEQNDSRRPVKYDLDLKAVKMFPVGANMHAAISLWVYNIFDIKNELDVYKDTGSADYTLEANQPVSVRGVNTLDDYFVRPDWFSTPRQVKLGLSLSF